MDETNKIKSLSDLETAIAGHKTRGEKVVHCHGVFDLLHPGHIRHFKEAKRQGDKLVVTATPDRYVNKGVGRPVFQEQIRLETLASISCIDYVALNDAPDAIGLIQRLKPDVYVKGIEYKNHANDVTNKISQEVAAVESCGGTMYYTDDIVFSSTELLNSYFGQIPEKVKTYIQHLKKRYQEKDLVDFIKQLEGLKVLVVGDAIIDDYQYVEPLGQSGKGIHMVARCRSREVFAGGVFAVANHVANFTSDVTLLTAIGARDGSRDIINTKLNSKIKCHYVEMDGAETLTKKRYVLRDGDTLSKLFETYSGSDQIMGKAEIAKALNFIREYANDYDAIIVSDFGNGFVNKEMIQALGETKTFLAINAQTNSGNRGYHVVTHYPRADYISLNEGELRLTAHDKHGDMKKIIEKVCATMSCRKMSVTLGVQGVLIYDQEQGYAEIPALTMRAIDRVGAGDSYLAVSSLCMARNIPFEVAGLIGSVAAAIDVQIVGNKESVDKIAVCKYITTLMK